MNNFGDNIDVVVGLIAVGIIEPVLQGAGHHHAGRYRARIHLHPVVARTQLQRPPGAQGAAPFTEQAVEVAFYIIEIDHAKSGIVEWISH